MPVREWSGTVKYRIGRESLDERPGAALQRGVRAPPHPRRGEEAVGGEWGRDGGLKCGFCTPEPKRQFPFLTPKVRFIGLELSHLLLGEGSRALPCNEV